MASSKKAVMRTSVRLLCSQISQELQNELKKFKNKKTRRWWVKKWILRRNTLGASEHLLREFATEDESLYKNHLRMSKDQFEVLLHRITPKIQKRNTIMRNALPARTKLEITLRFLGMLKYLTNKFSY